MYKSEIVFAEFLVTTVLSIKEIKILWLNSCKHIFCISFTRSSPLSNGNY